MLGLASGVCGRRRVPDGIRVPRRRVMMTRALLAVLLTAATGSTALAQSPCVPEGPPRAALARVRGDQTPPPPAAEPASADIQTVVGDGVANTFEPMAAASKVQAGQLVTMCSEDGTPSSLLVELTSATIRLEATACTGVTARTMLEGQVLLRSPEARRGRGTASRRPVYADAPDGWVVAPLESAEPTTDIARALAAVARQLGWDDRVVAWGVSNQGGASVVRILHTARFTVRERFADVGGIPVVWSELAKGAFERAGCSAAP